MVFISLNVPVGSVGYVGLEAIRMVDFDQELGDKLSDETVTLPDCRERLREVESEAVVMTAATLAVLLRGENFVV